MRSIIYIAILSFLVGCATKPDPVDQLVGELSLSPVFWTWGIYPTIILPESASPEQVVKSVFQESGFRTYLGNHAATSYTIMKIRQVSIPGDDVYTTALVKTDVGLKIVIFRYQTERQDKYKWWTRVYDAKPSA